MNSNPNRFKVLSKNENFWLDNEGWTFNLSPSQIVKLSLPPYIEGIDWFIRQARSIKTISSSSMWVNFSECFFLGCDAKLSYLQNSFGGWIYSIEGESLKFDNFRRIWICPHVNMYFEHPPNSIYVSLEECKSSGEKL